MTREDEIRERYSSATTDRGPWEVRDNDTVGVVNLGVICKVIVARFEPSTYNNAVFIANAPADIDYLLKENQRLRSASMQLVSIAQNLVLLYRLNKMYGKDVANFHSKLNVVKKALQPKEGTE